MILRLRLSLADRSGALAQAAAIVGLHDGNIRSIDVHAPASDGDERRIAVDDLIVEFTQPPDLDALRSDLLLDASTTLVRSEPAHLLDPIGGVLQAVFDMMRSERGTAELIRCLTTVCPAAATWTASGDEAAAFEYGARALAASEPVVVTTNNLPDHAAAPTGGEAAVLAIPLSGLGASLSVAFLARPPDWEFTATEVSRAAAVAQVFSAASSPVAG